MTNKTLTDKIREFMPKIDAISPSACLAKWYHVSIYLHLGENHSCYHPSPHKTPLAELIQNPSALHNSSFKKEQRALMLKGERPVECQYCWNIENLKNNHLSDRMIKSFEQGSTNQEYIDQIKKNGANFNYNPTVVEVSFSNACNFKCVYCHPKASTKWEQEIKEFGGYTEIENPYTIESGQTLKEEDNPYVEAWNAWWPELRKSLLALRITGGEPLLHQTTYKVLDDFIQNPNPNITLMINSNLGVTSSQVQKFIDKIQIIVNKKYSNGFKLYTSLESWGRRAEYVRFGLNLETWEKNLRSVLDQVPNCTISIMCTYNILCVTSFTEFLKKLLSLRKEYSQSNQRIELDISYLKEPQHLLMHLLPEDFVNYMDESILFMKSNLDDYSPFLFNHIELEKMERIREHFLSSKLPEEKLQAGRYDFFKFIKESDRRRNSSFLETFPEMNEFYTRCEIRAAK